MIKQMNSSDNTTKMWKSDCKKGPVHESKWCHSHLWYCVSPAYLVNYVTKVKKCTSSFNPMSLQLQTKEKKKTKKKKKYLFLSDFIYFLAWANYKINNSLSIITASIPDDIGKEPWNTIGKSKLMRSTAKAPQLTSKCLTENLGRVERGRVFEKFMIKCWARPKKYSVM